MSSRSSKRRRLNARSEREADLSLSSEFDYETQNEDLRRFRQLLCTHIVEPVSRTDQSEWMEEKIQEKRPREMYFCLKSLDGKGKEAILKTQKIQTLKRVFCEYTGEAACRIRKISLVTMFVARFQGAPFAFYTREEENRFLADVRASSNLQNVFVTLCGIAVPKEVMEKILNFCCLNEYSYDLVVSFGLCCWNCYRLLLTTWRRLTLRQDQLVFVSKVILGSVRDLRILSTSSWSQTDWSYLFGLVAKRLEKLALFPSSVFLKSVSLLESPMSSLTHVHAENRQEGSDRSLVILPGVPKTQFLNSFAPNLVSFHCSESSGLGWLTSISGVGPSLRKLRHIDCDHYREFGTSFLRGWFRSCPALQTFRFFAFRGVCESALPTLLCHSLADSCRMLEEVGVIFMSVAGIHFGPIDVTYYAKAMKCVGEIPSLERVSIHSEFSGNFADVPFVSAILATVVHLEVSLTCQVYGFSDRGSEGLVEVIRRSPKLQYLEFVGVGGLSPGYAKIDFSARSMTVNPGGVLTQNAPETYLMGRWKGLWKMLTTSHEILTKMESVVVQFHIFWLRDAESVLRQSSEPLSIVGFDWIDVGTDRGNQKLLCLTFRRQRDLGKSII